MNALASTSRCLAPLPLRTKSIAVPGYNHFSTPLRQLVVEYHPASPHHAGLRAWLREPLLELARSHPDVEVRVRQVKNGKAALLRGHYGECRAGGARGRTQAHAPSWHSQRAGQGHLRERHRSKRGGQQGGPGYASQHRPWSALTLRIDSPRPLHQAALILNSSGSKLRHLRRSILEAGPGAESARGIWSALHEAQGSEYRI